MKAFKRYNPQSSSSSGLLLETIVSLPEVANNDYNNNDDDEIVGILNKIKYISSDSPYIKDDRKIYNDSTYTDNDDSTVNTINSYHSNYSHYRDANPARYKAIHYMRKGDYRVALQLLDTIDDDYDYKLLCYRSICYSHLNHHDKAYEIAVQCINVINDQDKYPNVTIFLQLAKCQYNKKLYKDAIITLLKAHQANERSFIESDNNAAGNNRVKINDMIRKTKTEMRIDQEKNDPISKYSLPIIEYSKKHSSRIGNGNSNNNSPITVGSSSLQSSLGSSPNTTISSISYDSQDSFQQTSHPKPSSHNKNDNKNNKNTKKKKTKVLLPLIQPKIKSQFPKYKKGTTLRAVIELEKERKQELFRMNNKKSESISYFVNLLGTLS